LHAEFVLHATTKIINMVVGSGQQSCGPWAGPVSVRPGWLGPANPAKKTKKRRPDMLG